MSVFVSLESQLEKDAEELFILLERDFAQAKFDRDAILRDQDDGACQIWYQPSELKWWLVPGKSFEMWKLSKTDCILSQSKARIWRKKYGGWFWMLQGGYASGQLAATKWEAMEAAEVAYKSSLSSIEIDLTVDTKLLHTAGSHNLIDNPSLEVNNTGYIALDNFSQAIKASATTMGAAMCQVYKSMLLPQPELSPQVSQSAIMYQIVEHEALKLAGRWEVLFSDVEIKEIVERVEQISLSYTTSDSFSEIVSRIFDSYRVLLPPLDDHDFSWLDDLLPPPSKVNPKHKHSPRYASKKQRRGSFPGLRKYQTSRVFLPRQKRR